MSKTLLYSIYATLKIDVDVYHTQNLAINFVKRGEQVRSIEWRVSNQGIKFSRGMSMTQSLSRYELEKVVYEKKWITLYSLLYDESDKKTYPVESGTVEELLDIVLRYEKEFRPKEGRWFEGVDAHHIYFSGLDPCYPRCDKSDCISYSITWDS